MTITKIFSINARFLCYGVITALMPLPTAAIDRLNAQDYSCDGVNEQVKADGAVIVRYPSKRPPGLTLYDRYVADVGFCESDELLQSTAISTRDGMCSLSACRERSHSNDR
ncbi:hypothetical protein [Pararhizobium sp. DWP3-4]|uniref:hypothetical protein n=1 Tax=unclassified Pararhizobium TaxID=2643050 RepID=UPI003CF97638